MKTHRNRFSALALATALCAFGNGQARAAQVTPPQDLRAPGNFSGKWQRVSHTGEGGMPETFVAAQDDRQISITWTQAVPITTAKRKKRGKKDLKKQDRQVEQVTQRYTFGPSANIVQNENNRTGYLAEWPDTAKNDVLRKLNAADPQNLKNSIKAVLFQRG